MNPLICDDCQEQTTWEHAEQCDPIYGRVYATLCENCAERRYDRWQEYLMETSP